MMKYKGYIGKVVYDDEAGIFHGDVIGLKDVITFQGKTVEEIRQAFKDSIESYLEFCRQEGDKPEKTFCGRFSLRMEPEIHANIAHQAAMQGMSLNEFINEKLKTCA